MTTRARVQASATAPRAATPSLPELKEGLEIDEHALEEACVSQPILFYHVLSMVADIKIERDKAKERLAEVEAEADARLRHEAEVREEKVREADIANQKTLDTAVKAATTRLREANANLIRLEALRDSYSQRGYVLRDLVQLHMTNYYSDPIRGAESRVRGDVATEGLRRARRAQAGRD